MSYQLSTSKHFKSDELSPLGAGKVVIICSKILLIPSPVFPEHGIAFSVPIPITSSICFFVFSRSDAGRSTLFNTGTISWLISKAWYTFAKVCASTPWVLSTISIDPSQA